MTTRLVDIQPREVKLIFEVKKQSSCAIQLTNISEHFVAFKVKTTSPKKYCVRPNTGIIKPNSKCDVTVVMPAQRSVPSDLHCKDKFLIQSTIVPFSATEDDISLGLFSKDSGKYIEERKLKVILVSPPRSPSVLLKLNAVSKQESSLETLVQKEKPQSRTENLPPPPMLFKFVENINLKSLESRWSDDVNPSPVEDVNLCNDIQELKLKLAAMESRLNEADSTIRKLTEEKSTDIQEKEELKQELAMLKRKNGAREVHVGFPFLYVCMVALISLIVGYNLYLP